MNSIPYAYSKEHGDILSPDDAYDYYWEGILTNQHLFTCPGLNCQAEITLANMYKDQQEIKQAPHYRCKNHVADCEYIQSISQISKKRNSSNKSAEDDSIDEFLTTRPLSAKQSLPNKLENFIDESDRDIENRYRKYSAKPKFYSIRPIVDRYFALRESKRHDVEYIKIDDKKITYKNLFKGVYDQNVEDYSERRLIFWGIAYINYLRDKTGYRIVFQNCMTSNNESIKPSIVIKNYVLTNYRFKKRLHVFLNEALPEKGRQCLCFVFSKPTQSKTTSKTYINFNIESLDLIEFKETDYLNKLSSVD